MQPEDPERMRGDSTPPGGITPVRIGQASLHVHFWSDVTIPASEYIEEICNGEKWSPLSKDYVFPRGCGASRRIPKEVYPLHSVVRPPRPPDPAWEMVEP